MVVIPSSGYASWKIKNKYKIKGLYKQSRACGIQVNGSLLKNTPSILTTRFLNADTNHQSLLWSRRCKFITLQRAKPVLSWQLNKKKFPWGTTACVLILFSATLSSHTTHKQICRRVSLPRQFTVYTKIHHSLTHSDRSFIAHARLRYNLFKSASLCLKYSKRP